MANKTLRFFGNGYDQTGNAAVVVTFNGNTVYTGEIPTINDTLVLTTKEEQQEIFRFDVDQETYGTFPMTIEVTGGEFIVSGFGESTGAGNPPDFTQFYMLGDFGFADNRSNVKIDGVAQTKGPLEDVLTGPWYYTVHNGSTLSADILVLPYGNITGNVTP